MNRNEIVLAAMAPANGASHGPVQIQKLLFLIDKEAAHLVEGAPFFRFRPYHYGPFDKNVYQSLDALRDLGYVDVHPRSYRLTTVGQRIADDQFRSLMPPAQDYISRVSTFVRRLDFSQLVSAIYKAYPEMRENSVFQS